MLVATHTGQTTTAYTLHNANSSGTATKKTTTNNTSAAATTTATGTTGTPKLFNSINSGGTLNSFSNSYKNGNNVNSSLVPTQAGTAAKDINNHSNTFYTTNSFCAASNNNNNQRESCTQQLLKTLKDKVQKVLINNTSSNGNTTTATTQNSTTNNNSNNPSNNATNNSKITNATNSQNVTSSSTTLSSKRNINNNNNNNNTNSTIATLTTTTTTAATSSTLSSSKASSSSSTTTTTIGAANVARKYTSASLTKLYTIAPTKIHRYAEEREHTGSTDSLQKEMCHFKPIKTVPTTPWKSGSKSRNNSLRFPKANLATSKDNTTTTNTTSSISLKTEFILKSNCDVIIRKQHHSPQPICQDMDEDINDDDDDYDDKDFFKLYKPKPSLTFFSSFISSPDHLTPFVCLNSKLMSMQIKKLTAAKAAQDVREQQLKDEKTAKRKEQQQAKRTKKNRNSIAKSSTAAAISCVKKPIASPSSALSKKSVAFKAAASLSNSQKSIKAVTSNASASKKVPKSANKSRLAGGGVLEGLTATENDVVKVAKRRGRPPKKKVLPNTIDQEDNSPMSIIAAKETAAVAGQPAEIEKSTLLRKRKLAEQPKETLPSAKTSKITAVPAMSLKQTTTTRLPNGIPAKKRKKLQNAVVKAVFSPPITRSRLKQLTNEQQQQETPKKVANTKVKKN